MGKSMGTMITLNGDDMDWGGSSEVDDQRSFWKTEKESQRD